MVVSGSSDSGQTPSIPSANSATVKPTPSVTCNAAAIHISQDPHLVKEARTREERNVPLQVYQMRRLRGNKLVKEDRIQKERNVPLMVYQRRRLRGNKKEQAAAATIEDPAARPSTSTPPTVFTDLVESVVLELDLINQNTSVASKKIFTCKKMATELEERVAILEKELTAKADELEAKVKSVEEAADRRFQEQQEKIDFLTAEKVLVTQDLKGELEAVSHELEQHKKILEKERARISQFEVEKKKIAVLADVTATYNLLLSFVAAVPEFDYSLLGDDIVQKVEEIRLKLAKEEEKSAIKEAGGEGQVGSRR